MKINLNTALAKLAKEIVECSGNHQPIHSALVNAKPRLIKEYKNAVEFPAFQVLEIADIPAFDVNEPVIFVGPFSYKYGCAGNYVERICKVAGAAFIDPSSPQYEYIFPTNGNFIASLDRVVALYDLMTYNDRYRTVFGYTIPEMTANKMIRDFTNLYFPDLNTVTPTLDVEN